MHRIRSFSTRSPSFLSQMQARPLATRVLKVDPSSITFSLDQDIPNVSSPETLEVLREAAHRLSSSCEPVAFPTETVYGLGAVATHATAPLKIFSTKGRPADNPLIVHVSSLSMLQSILPLDYVLPETYKALMRTFWPGALTLLFPRDQSKIPDVITAGQSTVAVRMPSHPVARALIAISNVPIAAPSANSSGKPSPTRAEHVLHDLGGKVGLILDGGPCGIGLESTVVDGLGKDRHLRILRPGGITVEQIQESLDQAQFPRVRVLVHGRDYNDEQIKVIPTTPGMKYRHYSPSVPVVLIHPANHSPPPIALTTMETLLESLSSLGSVEGRPVKIGILSIDDSPLQKRMSQLHNVESSRFSLGPPGNLSVAARRLFDGLISLEAAGVQAIIVEAVGEDNEGLAVMNRLRKAASMTMWIDLTAVGKDGP